MQITLTNVGKRYNYEWIFRKVDYEFTCAHNYVILGSNGSGKSTLLQVIAGNLIASEGTIQFKVQSSKLQTSKTKAENNSDLVAVEEENRFLHLSYAAPYLDLLEEFTLAESIEFQAQFKPFRESLTTKQIIEIIQLEKAKDKQLKYYSSGMRQRVRLALAVLADTPLLLLDEPTSNLDKKAIDWYQNLVNAHAQNRLIIVASNQQEYEYPFCDKQLSVEQYK